MMGGSAIDVCQKQVSGASQLPTNQSDICQTQVSGASQLPTNADDVCQYLVSGASQLPTHASDPCHSEQSFTFVAWTGTATVSRNVPG